MQMSVDYHVYFMIVLWSLIMLLSAIFYCLQQVLPTPENITQIDHPYHCITCKKNSYQTLKFVKCTAHFDNFYRSSLNNYSIFEPQF
jgi:hypothetical protein